MLLVKSVYDLSEIVSEINKDDPYRAKMGFNRVFRWKCFRTQLHRANENMNIWVPNYLKWRKFEREMQITQDCGKHSLGEGVKALGCSSLNCGRVKRGVSGSFNFLCSYWQLLLVHSYQIMLFVAVLQLLVGSNVRGSPSASSKVKLTLYICKQHTVQFLPEFQKEVTNATLITEQSIMCTAGAQQASIKSKIVNLRVDQFLK